MSELSVPACALALLFGTEPTDRALTGWMPLSDVQRHYATFLREHGCRFAWPPRW
jgi:hypothetical protein